jgi:imidazolonepropionase-like amidohydrolase
MRLLLVLLVAVAAHAEPLCFTHGHWFNGKTFEARTLCTSDGVFVTRRPPNARNIDLQGAYVIPPFAEAHNHNVEESAALPGRIAEYLRNGIFYVKNPNSLPRTTPRALVNTPQSIDAVFAMGGLTGTDGHPAGVMKRNIDRGAATVADADGAFYHQVDSRADLDRRWPLLLAAKPDFIKTYLLYSEEYTQRKTDPAKYAWKGLDPALLPEIVKRAHAAGLRVTTHVETATDFHHAVAAGVDEIGHLPGFRSDGPYVSSRFHITDADAKRAARRGIVVVTTVGATLAQGERVVNDTIAANLRTLRRHGVQLALGSDDYRNGILPEVAQLRALGIFTDAELLDLWTRATPRSIFPTRKIGRLARGYEASFLVLDGDPLADFANTARIRMRVKRGEVLAALE